MPTWSTAHDNLNDYTLNMKYHQDFIFFNVRTAIICVFRLRYPQKIIARRCISSTYDNDTDCY